MWREMPFDSCIKKIKTPPKVPKKLYMETGYYPVVSQEAVHISGYYDDPSKVFRVEKPVVIFGDHTRTCKYVDFDFIVGADGVKVFLPDESINSKYFYYFILANTPKDKGYARHYRFLKQLTVPIPSLAEQKRIVERLDKAFGEIDKAIATAEAKEGEIERLKAATLSAMLNRGSQSGESITEDEEDSVMWKTVRLGDVVSYIKNNAQNSHLPYVGLENIASETMSLAGEITVRENTSTTFSFDESHVLYGRLRPYLKKVFLPDFKGQCSTEIFCLQPKSNVLRGFLAYWLIESSTAAKIESTSTGARMPRANMNALLNFEFPLPPLAEQKRIVERLDKAFAEIEIVDGKTQSCVENYAALKASILKQELTPSEAV